MQVGLIGAGNMAGALARGWGQPLLCSDCGSQAAPLAAQRVADTMAASAPLPPARDYDTIAVRREVRSPGGSTARGLAALEEGGIRSAFQEAMDAVVGWSKS